MSIPKYIVHKLFKLYRSVDSPTYRPACASRRQQLLWSLNGEELSRFAHWGATALKGMSLRLSICIHGLSL